ncbi:hypothetical protein evm_005254 [Chilo suppressalis]|nr:hypothetical protein evm_005254 [Chilo suppressalis]
MGMTSKPMAKKDSSIKPAAKLNKKQVIIVKNKLSHNKGVASSDSELTVDVIDLGAPRSLRREVSTVPGARARPAPRVYTPNPRL